MIKDIGDIHEFYQNHIIYDYEEKIKHLKSEANLYTSKIKSFEKYCEDLNSSNTFLQSSIEYYRQLMAEKAHILKSLKVKL